MILIGTVHTDLDGPRRLKCILEKYKPRKITVEMPKNKLEKILNDFSEFRSIAKKNFEKVYGGTEIIKLINELIQIYGYEFNTTYDYAKSTGAELYAIDYMKSANMKSPNYVEGFHYIIDCLISSWSIYKDLDADAWSRHYKNSVTAFYNRTNKAIYSIESFYPDITSRRERIMAKRILRIMPEMHIGGFSHIFDEHLAGVNIIPLHKRLGNVPSEKIRLCEVDYLKEMKKL